MAAVVPKQIVLGALPFLGEVLDEPRADNKGNLRTTRTWNAWDMPSLRCDRSVRCPATPLSDATVPTEAP